MSPSRKALLDLCKEKDLLETLNHLKLGEFTHWKDEIGTKALQLCAANGWKEAVEILIENGCDVNSTDSAGWTPLMHAASNGHRVVVEQLLLAGSNIAAHNYYGWDALSLAITSMDIDTVNTLIPLAKLPELSQALLISCQVGYASLTEILIDHHANVNTQLPNSGVTPLMLAASEGRKSIVEILLSRGADPDIKSAMNITALDVAISCGHSDIKETLGLATKKQWNIPKVVPPIDNYVPSKSYCEDSTSFITHIILHSSPRDHPSSFPGAYLNNKLGKNNFQLSPQNLAPQQHIYLSPASPCDNSVLTPNIHHPCFEFPPSIHFGAAQNYIHVSPSCGLYPSSPLIPGWIFSSSPNPNQQKGHSLKKTRSLGRWWNKIKRRCKRKHQPIKVDHKPYKNDISVAADQELEALIKNTRLKTLLPILQAHEIDVHTFLGLSDEDLKEIGIRDDMNRAKILREIKRLNNRN